MSEQKLSIDEQLEAENKKFDARIAAEAKVERKAAGERAVVKPAKSRVPPKRQRFQVGDVAHVHYSETPTEMIERDCPYVEHLVRDKKGYTINEKTYKGKVIVPRCTANYLGMMERQHKLREREMYENRGRKVDYGEVTG